MIRCPSSDSKARKKVELLLPLLSVFVFRPSGGWMRPTHRVGTIYFGIHRFNGKTALTWKFLYRRAQE